MQQTKRRHSRVANTTDRVYEAIAAWWLEHGYAPSTRDIVQTARLSSTSVANRYIARLRREGRIQYEPGVARTVRIVAGPE